MKRHFLLVALLTIIPIPFVAQALLTEETQFVQSQTALNFEKNKTTTTVAQLDPGLTAYAQSISVKISSNNKGKGSGVLIGKQENKYLVITNNHVLRGGESFTIQTEDGTNHQATVINNPITSDDDIALLTFESDNSYQPIRLNSTDAGNLQKDIYAVGYAADTGEFSVEPGKIEHITEQPFQQGYRIGYSNNVRAGMSGGAIFDETGDLIGINGISAYPILDTVYQYEDGTKPNSEELDKFRSLSWGLSLHRLLTQVNPEIITAYDLPLPETVAEIGNIELTGWLVDLEAKAKQFTVKIDSSSKKNGSGVIIAKEGNTYTVLTVDHVLCEKPKDREFTSDGCEPRSYTITTPDGKQYPLDQNTINAQAGVDLAVFRFDSDEIYQVAELANYPLAKDDPVFVAGFPKLVSNKPAGWVFSLGYGLEREQGLININAGGSSGSENLILQEEPEGTLINDVDSVTLARGSTNSVIGQGSLSGGYEMVYTSATYGGMSGGAVLDRKGRVIGIHGAAEGETALDIQSGSKKQVQMGYSLGIPINTFIGIAERFNVSNTFTIQNNRPEALNSQEKEEFETATLGAKISQGNTTAEGWLERGNILWRLKQYNKSVEAFDRAIKLNPDFVHLAYYGKGIALYRDKKYEASVASFEKANQANPNYEPAFSWKNAAFRRLEKWDESLLAINRAINLNSDNPVLYSEKSLTLRDLQRYSEAKQAISKAIELSPRSAFYGNRAYIYQLQDKLELAKSDYEKALSINPNDTLALYYIANSYRYGSFYPKNKLKALELYQKSSNLGDNDAAFQAATMLIEGEGVEKNYDLAGKLLLDAANRDSVEAKSKLVTLIVKQKIPNESNIDVEQMAISADEKGYPEGLQTIVNSLVNGKNGYQPDVEKGAVLANEALKRFEQRSPSEEGAYPGNKISFAAAIKKGLENGVIQESQVLVSLAELKQQYFRKDSMKRFTVPIDCGSIGKHPFHIYIWDAEESIEGLKDQFQWVREARGCEVPKDIQVSFGKLYNIAKENNVLFTELSVYALGDASKKKEQAETNNSGEAFINQEQSNSNNNALAYVNRGRDYYKEEKLDLAIEQYSKAIELNPKEPTAYELRSSVYIQQDKYQLALVDVNKAIELGSTNSAIYFIRGVFYTDNKPDLALNDFSKAIELDSKYVQAYLRRGDLYLKQEQLDLALVDLNRVLELDPSNEKAYESRSTAYIKQEKYDLALADINKAIELDSQSSNVYQLRGLFNASKNSELALNDFSKAIELDPDDARAYFYRGDLYRKQSKFDLALADINRGIEIDPKKADTEVYFDRGNIYFKQQKYDLALADYNQSLTLDNSNILPLNNIGLVQYEMGEIERAEQQFTKVIEINDKLAEPQLSLATALFVSGKTEEAIAIAKSALNLDIKFADSEHLKDNLWGEQLISDTERLLAHPEIQDLLAEKTSNN